MIERTRYLDTIEGRLKRFPVVSVLGPRQVGKTTLARTIAGRQPSHFFDLEDIDARARLAEPKAALERLSGLVVLDEVQRQPELFALLRVLADRKPVRARFLLTGSASPGLVRGVSESLAGRVALVDVSGFNLEEVGNSNWRTLWWRGGFPLAHLAATDGSSREWQEEFVRTLLERDMPQLGITIPATALRRFWTMLTHYHGQVWKGSELARSMSTSEPTMRRYLDILSSTFMVRQLAPWYENLSKRQVKSPKIYLRDSGLLHCLLRVEEFADLEAHPKLGASWEGFALEQVLQLTGDRDAWFWATHAGAELDLLVHSKGRRYGFEFKYGDAPSMTKSMHTALHDLRLERLFVVYPGRESYPMNDRTEAVGITNLQARLTDAGIGNAPRG
ncbi:MAG: ATP-binding protein [Verrucomicrobiales bacterium]|nr:ATP-binding protein [Verrucomicrobiales bacterium]